MPTGFWWRELKKPLERPRRRWENNGKINLQDSKDWIDVAEGRER